MVSVPFEIETSISCFVFVYRVEPPVKSKVFNKKVDKSREFGYLNLDEWEPVQRACQSRRANPRG